MTLTKSDLQKFDSKLENQKVDILKNVDSKLENLKGEIFEGIDDKLQNLKSDLFDKIDPILKEVTTAREERPLIENRLEELEKIHPQGKHAVVN